MDITLAMLAWRTRQQKEAFTAQFKSYSDDEHGHNCQPPANY